jgi:hypothetical protein
MHYSSNDDDPWLKFRQRREEWRARHEARRQAWKERHARRRAQWAEHWGNMSQQFGMDPADWGMEPQRPGASHSGPNSSGDVEALKAQVATMQKTIEKLLGRVAVLEKLAVDGDDTRLAAEIEKLRDRGTKP